MTPLAASTPVVRRKRLDQLLFWLREVVVKTTSPSGRFLSVTKDAHSRAAMTDLPEPGGPLMTMTFLGGAADSVVRNVSLTIERQSAKALRWLSRSSKTSAFGLRI